METSSESAASTFYTPTVVTSVITGCLVGPYFCWNLTFLSFNFIEPLFSRIEEHPLPCLCGLYWCLELRL